MNANLRNLLVVVGFLGAGGAVMVLTPKAGVTKAQLGNAGILTDCVRRDRVCQFYGDECPDGGYCRKRFDVAVCPGTGQTKEVIVPRALAAALRRGVDEDTWCKAPTASTLTADAVQDEPWDCACSTGATCERQTAPGVWVAEPKTGNTLAEGTWRGAGCRTKPCVEAAGFGSMPNACL